MPKKSQINEYSDIGTFVLFGLQAIVAVDCTDSERHLVASKFKVETQLLDQSFSQSYYVATMGVSTAICNLNVPKRPGRVNYSKHLMKCGSQYSSWTNMNCLVATTEDHMTLGAPLQVTKTTLIYMAHQF